MNDLTSPKNLLNREDPRMVIVGGLGAMGKLFERIFHPYMEEIVIVDRETDLRPSEAVATADIVLISVSIGKTIDLIKEVAPHLPPDSLLMDVTSLKEAEMNAMMEFSNPNVEILGTHPLFGPYNEIAGQVIALTPVRGTVWLAYIKEIFNRAGLMPVIVTATEHDKLMSFVQVMLHVILFSMVETAQALQLDTKLLKTISTPLYKIVWTLGERILNHDSQLYRHIALGNAYSLETLKIFRTSFDQLLETVAKHDGDAFEKQFHNLRQFLAHSDEEKQQLAEQSQHLIDSFSKDFLADPVFRKMLKDVAKK